MITAIDPDLRKSGVCTIDDEGNILLLKSMSAIELIEYVKANPDHVYGIEDVNKIGAMYATHKHRNPRIAANIAQKVGMVKGVATLIAQLIDACTGREPIMCPVGLGKQIKNNAALFKKLTGYQGSTNEDTRDAYAIATWILSEKIKCNRN